MLPAASPDHDWKFVQRPDSGEKDHWQCQRCGYKIYTSPLPGMRVQVEEQIPTAQLPKSFWRQNNLQRAIGGATKRQDLTCEEYVVYQVQES